MTFERSIKVAFDKISGEILEADEVFDEAKNAFEVRKQFHKDEIELYCCECGQKLNVSTSKYDRLHFKHQPKAKPCLLKDGKFSPEETDQLIRIYKAKESDRHKGLKNKIALKISKLEGIHSVNVDDKFIIDNSERRKPDVYCKYFDKELVFEIQLSDLSLRYILNRYEFYKRNKIYLIWILDNFDVSGQSQTVRDLKYLTEFENFFKFDEESDVFKLICTYKYPFLTDQNKLLTKWVSQSVSLDQIKFAQDMFQIFYFNYGQKEKLKEKEQNNTALKQKEEEKRQKEIEKQENATRKVQSILEELRNKWREKSFSFESIKHEIADLDDYEIEVLNSSSAFKPMNNEPKIHYWFSIAHKEHFHFLEFMLECDEIVIDVNEMSSSNNSLFHTLFQNQSIDFKLSLMKKILKRNYLFKTNDEQLIRSLNFSGREHNSIIIVCYLSNKLKDKSQLDTLFNYKNLICTIESAKRDEIVGFGYKPSEWIAFANNAIHSYKEYWEYIEVAFKHYGIWEKLIKLDRNATFQKKLNTFYETRPDKKYDCDRLFFELYPELFE